MSLQLLPTGTLSFSLVGYSNIPTDGRGRILITDIGASNERALICSTDISTSTTSNWYLHPNMLTTSIGNHIRSTRPQGWMQNRLPGILRLRRVTNSSTSVEGVFTCGFYDDGENPISVRIHYSSETQAINYDIILYFV